MAKSNTPNPANKNTTPPAPQPSKYEIKVLSVKTLAIVGSFEVTLEVRSFKDGVSLKNEAIVAKHDFSPVPMHAATDSSGTCNFAFTVPDGNAGRTIPVRVYFASRSEEAGVNITLPAAKKSDLGIKEADNISVVSWIITDDGKTTLDIRVTGDRGEVSARKICCIQRGKNTIYTTNELGHYSWELSENVCPGKKEVVFVTADSIAERCKITIYNAPVPCAKVTFKQYANTMSVRVFAFITFASLIIAIMCIKKFFSTSVLDSMKSTASNHSDIMSLLVAVCCIIVVIAFIYYTAWYFASKKVIRAQQSWSYKHSRVTIEHVKDPAWENIFDEAKNALKKDDKATSVQSVFSNSSVASATGPSPTANDFKSMDFMNEFKVQSIFKIGEVAWKWFKKL